MIRLSPGALLGLLGFPKEAELDGLATDCCVFRLKINGVGPEEQPHSLMRETIVTVHTRQDTDGTRWFRCQPLYPAPR